jgi:hypothetical protein
MSTPATGNGTRTKADFERAGAKPEAPPVLPDNISAALRDRAQWVCWRYQRVVNSRGEGRWTKAPVNPRNGRNAKANDPSTWGTFDAALAWHRAHPDDTDGIGIMLADGLVGIDLDDCLDADGSLKPWAAPLVADLNSYTDRSPSGTGVKVIGLGGWPGRNGGAKAHRRPCGDGEVEGYDERRFFVVTGHPQPGTPAEVNQVFDAVTRLYARVFTAAAKTGSTPSPRAAANGNGRAAGRNGLPFRVRADGECDPSSDDGLIKLAGRAKNGEKFRALWGGSTAGYKSPSEADAALCGLLAFWTGGDRERIDRLFRASGLYREEKWGAREDYRERTLDFVLEGRTEFYTPRVALVRMRGGGDPADGRSANGRAAGCPGSNGHCAPAGAPTVEQPEGKPTIHAMILAFFGRKYDPIFRRRSGAATTIYSRSLGRDVRASEACYSANGTFIESLAGAKDAPRYRDELPRAYRLWAPVAWTDLVDGLDDEQEGAEVADAAQEEFRAKVADALHTPVSFGRHYDKDDPGGEGTDTQRRSLIEWCLIWAKPGSWKKARLLAWTKLEGGDGPRESRLRVAVRPEVFGQLAKGCELSRLGQNKFTRLAERYGVGAAQKAGGRRVVELTPEFIQSLLVAPVDKWTEKTPHAGAPASDPGKTSERPEHA